MFHQFFSFFFFFTFRSFGQLTEQQECDGVLKVNKHYSGEDTGMNIWTVSGQHFAASLVHFVSIPTQPK